MKTITSYLLVSFAFATFVFLPNSFAQRVSPEYVVRAIYFLPKDLQPNPNVEADFDTLLKDVQRFYADQMERHGFGRKTFRLETDRAGKVVVHRVNGRFASSHYSTDPVQFVSVKVIPEITERFDTSKNIYLIAASLDQEIGGVGSGEPYNGFAITTHNSICDPVGDSLQLTIHELGHAFGLPHDFRTAGIMSYSWRYLNQLSRCAAEWLDVHRYFNRNPTDFDTPTTMEMLPPLAYPPNAIRFRFEITDADGLHQAQLSGLPDNSIKNYGLGLIACKSLNGKSNAVEFVTTELTLGPDSIVELSVIDKHGNFTKQVFPIRENDVRVNRQNRIDINGDGVTNANDRIPVTLRKISGDNQHGVPNSWLPNPFVVEVLDANGDPVVGVEVVFRVTPYPIESVSAEVRTDWGVLSDTNPRTGANGRAQSFLFLGYQPGFRPSVNVSVIGVSRQVRFNAISREEVLINQSEYPNMYWIDTTEDELYGPDGTKWLFANDAKSVVFDGLNRQLYWIGDTNLNERSCGVIKRADPDISSSHVEIATFASVPLGIAINPLKGKLYWTNAHGNIQTCNLDGSNIQNLITGINSPKHITMDTAGGKLYWTDGRERIRRADLNGRNIQTFARSSGTLGNITVAGGHLY